MRYSVSEELPTSLLVGGALLVALLLHAIASSFKSNLSAPLPPGPRGWPIVGSMFAMPKTHLWLWFDELFQKHGPIISFRYGNQTYVVVGRHDVAQELLVKRSGKNSDRPPMHAFDLATKGRRFIFLKASDPGWRVARKMVSQVMSEVRQGRSAKLSEFECKHTIQRIMATPGDWRIQFQRFAGSSILGAVYGIHVPVENTAEIKRLHERTSRTNVLANPRSFIVNAFPALDMIVPARLAPWHKLANEVEAEAGLFDELYATGMEKGRQGIENWLWRFKKSKDLPHLKGSTVTLPYIAGDMFGAGVNTTWISLQNFVLASLLYPEAFVRAREEIDRVVGQERLPLFTDREQMPYCEAVYREILRWRVAVPHGLYHEQAVDDILECDGKSYLIPKNAVLIGNIYSIEHDPMKHPEPHRFWPERHLEDDLVTLKPDTTVAFGFGRRVCVGQPMAERSVWIMVTHLLWLFSVERAPGDTAPLDQFAETGSAVAHPLPFKALLLPKSPRHADIAKRDFEEYDKNLAHLV